MWVWYRYIIPWRTKNKDEKQEFDPAFLYHILTFIGVGDTMKTRGDECVCYKEKKS